MKQMFASATLKLTAWYLVILMMTSIFFSILIYQISSSEVRTRLHVIEQRFSTPLFDSPEMISFKEFRNRQLEEANVTLFVALLHSNILILAIGGVGSYFLARRTLAPIEDFQQEQDRFTSDVSHELRTPLAVMKSELEVAERDKNLTKQELRELLESNLEEVNRLSTLSETLLKMSRGNFSDLELSIIDIGPIIRKTISAHKHVPKTRFNVWISGKELVRGNQASIRELFAILIDNALTYSPDDSVIDITLDSKDGVVIATIRNTGPGINENDLPHIFDRFYRGEKSRSTTAGGYGLGLSLAKNITDLHDGELCIESVPNEYTTVKISLKKFLKK